MPVLAAAQGVEDIEQAWEKTQRTRGGLVVMRGGQPADEATMGLAPGLFIEAEVDNYGLARLPGARDGMLVTLAITEAMVVATFAPLVIAPAIAWVPYAVSFAGLGAIYLSGRAVMVCLRTRS